MWTQTEVQSEKEDVCLPGVSVCLGMTVMKRVVWWNWPGTSRAVTRYGGIICSGVNSMKIALINKQFEIDGLIKLHRLGRTE